MAVSYRMRALHVACARVAHANAMQLQAAAAFARRGAPRRRAKAPANSTYRSRGTRRAVDRRRSPSRHFRGTVPPSPASSIGNFASKRDIPRPRPPRRAQPSFSPSFPSFDGATTACSVAGRHGNSRPPASRASTRPGKGRRGPPDGEREKRSGGAHVKRRGPPPPCVRTPLCFAPFAFFPFRLLYKRRPTPCRRVLNGILARSTY
jgi:hypothetical protein